MKNFDIKKISGINMHVLQFDIISLLINIALVSFLSDVLSAFADAAGRGVKDAKIFMSVFCLALVFLLPIGAIFKRWNAFQKDEVPMQPARWLLIFFFINQLMFCFYSFVLLKEALTISSEITIGLIILIPFVAVINTFIVKFYFSPLKREFPWKFLQTPHSQLIGDTCLFFSLLWNQMLWALVLNDSDHLFIGLLLNKILILGFLALFIYLPPRILYLTKVSNPWMMWGSMIISNLPIIIHVL
jgi:hypothetical protein